MTHARTSTHGKGDGPADGCWPKGGRSLGSLAALMVRAAERSGVAYCNGTYTVEEEGATYRYSWPGRVLQAEQRVGMRRIELAEGEGETLAGRLETICGLQADREGTPLPGVAGW